MYLSYSVHRWLCTTKVVGRHAARCVSLRTGNPPIGLHFRLAELRPNPHYPPSESCAFDPPLNPLICVCAQPPSISTAVGGVVGIDGTFRIERSARVRPDRARVFKVGIVVSCFGTPVCKTWRFVTIIFWAVSALGELFSSACMRTGLRRLHNNFGGWCIINAGYLTSRGCDWFSVSPPQVFASGRLPRFGIPQARLCISLGTYDATAAVFV